MALINNYRIFLFGESEKGDYCTPLRFNTLLDLSSRLGEPPENSTGLDYAIQMLMHQQELIFFRVKEEGFCRDHYMRGIKLLYNHGNKMRLTAICLPGVGDREIIESVAEISLKLRTPIILSEKDLYDYLTGSKY